MLKIVYVIFFFIKIVLIDNDWHISIFLLIGIKKP